MAVNREEKIIKYCSPIGILQFLAILRSDNIARNCEFI